MFEALVNAFACQQLALEVRLELLNRLGTLCSARVGTLQDARYAFPSAHDVARLPPEEYRAIGFSHQKVRALLGLARAIVQRELDLESIAGENHSEVRQRLLELRGVGWGTPPLDYAGVRRAVEGWQPYAGPGVFPPPARRVVPGGALGRDPESTSKGSIMEPSRRP
jgi:DNA-3-methyladenine glycosylase II